MRTTIWFTIFILLTIIDYSKRLTCYDCEYWEGQPGSVDACKDDIPGDTYIVNCTMDNLMSTTNKLQSILTSGGDGASNINNHRDIGDLLCAKMAGYLEGRPAVVRICIEAGLPEDLNGRSAILENGEDDVIIHFCNHDNCNTTGLVGPCLNPVTPAPPASY